MVPGFLCCLYFWIDSRGDHKIFAHVRHHRGIYRQIVFDLQFVLVGVDVSSMEKYEIL